VTIDTLSRYVWYSLSVIAVWPADGNCWLWRLLIVSCGVQCERSGAVEHVRWTEWGERASRYTHTHTHARTHAHTHTHTHTHSRVVSVQLRHQRYDTSSCTWRHHYLHSGRLYFYLQMCMCHHVKFFNLKFKTWDSAAVCIAQCSVEHGLRHRASYSLMNSTLLHRTEDAVVTLPASWTGKYQYSLTHSLTHSSHCLSVCLSVCLSLTVSLAFFLSN